MIKIKLNTWNRKGNRNTKFKRNIAPREGYIDLCPLTKKVIIKNASTKWKPWDTSISRKTDKSYIEDKKKLYSGLCFENRKQAKNFMITHKEEIDKIAKNNPLFDHWSIMSVIKRFEPTNIIYYKKDTN